MTLHLGAAVYFDHELADDPAPLAALLERLAVVSELRMWTARARTSTKLTRFVLDKLIANVRAPDTVTVGVETPERGVTVIVSSGQPGNSLPRAWKHDLVLALAHAHVAMLGQDTVTGLLCDFASATAATAGIVLWSPALSYARALALLASGDDLTPAQASRVTDAYYWRAKWGDVIRGPEWGTFLSPTHVATLGARALPAARVTALASGGAFVQATSEPFDVDAPPPMLAALGEALSPVRPG